MIVGVNAKIRELYHAFPHSSLSFAMAVEQVTGGKRGSIKHLLISHHEPAKGALFTATAARQPVALDLFEVASWR
jgi:hypothetical protein